MKDTNPSDIRTKYVNDCPQACTCSLGYSEIINECYHNVTYKSLIVYPNNNIDILNLSFCGLDIIKSHAFIMFTVVDLSHNNLTLIESGAFNGLRTIIWLKLSHNMLGFFFHEHTLSSQVFVGLGMIEWLWLDNNQISLLPANIFAGLSQLEWLFLRGNNISQLSMNTFKGLANLSYLYLNYNLISQLPAIALAGCNNLVLLDLSRNQISELHVPDNAFPGLIYLYLSNNHISELSDDAFAGNELTALYLNNNKITRLSDDALKGLFKLTIFNIKYNMISDMSIVVGGLTALKDLGLSHNQISHLSAQAFSQTSRLLRLYLSHNRLTDIPANIFNSMGDLNELYLQNNNIHHLPRGLFGNNSRLIFLNLSSNNINIVAPYIFQPCGQLSFIDLSNNPLHWVNANSFVGHIEAIYVEHFSTCCFIEISECYSKNAQSPFLTCNRLIPFSFLRVAMWILGAGAIVGNVGSICHRYKQMTRSMTVQLLLIVNLSVSDFLMGIYLVILASVDSFYTEYFPSHSDEWRNGVLCQVAGIFGTLSSEASVFFVTLISIDRYLGIKYPFSDRRPTFKTAKIVTTISWCVALAISIITSQLSNFGLERLQGVPEVCVSLPISRHPTYKTSILNRTYDNSAIGVFGEALPLTKTVHFINTDISGSESSMFFSIAVFTGLNLVCFLIVTFCYLSIFVEVRRSASRSGRSRDAREELRMAKRMSAIVITDLCCWMPIIVLSILVQGKLVTISPSVYVWIATFVLPINSTINPFLYTLATALCDWLEKKETQSESRQLRP